MAAVDILAAGRERRDRRRRGRRAASTSGSSARASTPRSTRSPTPRGCRSARSSTPTARCGRWRAGGPRTGTVAVDGTEHSFDRVLPWPWPTRASSAAGCGWCRTRSSTTACSTSRSPAHRPKSAYLRGLNKVFKGTHVHEPGFTLLRGREITFGADRPFTAVRRRRPDRRAAGDRARAARRAAGDRAVRLQAGLLAARATGAVTRLAGARRHVAARQGADARRAARDRPAGGTAAARAASSCPPPTARRRPRRWSPRPAPDAARSSCTTARGRTWPAASPPRCPPRPRRPRRPRAVRGRRVLARPGRSRARAARGAARQPVPRPARPLRRAGDHRRPLGRDRRRPAAGDRPRAQRRRPAGRRPRPRPRRRLYFGVQDDALALPELQHASDSKHCRRCGHAYAYEAAYLAHLGRYECPNCGAAPPRPRGGGHRRRAARHPLGRVHARHAGAASGGSSCRSPASTTSTTRSAPPRCACGWASPLNEIAAGLGAVAPAFGRAETVSSASRPTSILLVKNPAGANEVLRTLALEGTQLDLFGVLNDRTADGRDVSWVWDADWELLAPHVRRLTCSGTRAAELALRLKYAGVDAGAAEGGRRPRARARRGAGRRRAARCTRCPPTRRCSSCTTCSPAAARREEYWR